MKKMTLTIDGMACGMCESHVNQALRDAFHPQKVKASHKKGTAILIAEDAIPEAQLKEALAPTGYKVLSVTTEDYKPRGLFGR